MGYKLLRPHVYQDTQWSTFRTKHHWGSWVKSMSSSNSWAIMWTPWWANTRTAWWRASPKSTQLSFCRLLWYLFICRANSLCCTQVPKGLQGCIRQIEKIVVASRLPSSGMTGLHDFMFFVLESKKTFVIWIFFHLFLMSIRHTYRRDVCPGQSKRSAWTLEFCSSPRGFILPLVYFRLAPGCHGIRLFDSIRSWGPLQDQQLWIARTLLE